MLNLFKHEKKDDRTDPRNTVASGKDGKDGIDYGKDTETIYVREKHEDEDNRDGEQKNEKEDELRLPPEPELPPLVYGWEGGITYWGFSQRGTSHEETDTPCQDRCLIEAITSEGKSVILAAIADGVGSCVLSHYGAAYAVGEALASLKKDLTENGMVVDDKFAGEMLRRAMAAACDRVRAEAEGMEQLEYSFQSTLTIVVYDGSTLYFGHAGDDGIVAILDNGTMDLATVRKKGVEASSVYPLQSMDWEIRKADDVNALVMATDGVLDAFVKNEVEGNRIYYPFIEPAVEPGKSTVEDVKKVAEFYYSFMEGPQYRSRVTDDLTMVVLTNQNKISKDNLPVFDEEAWNAYTREREASIRAALYPDTRPGGLKKTGKEKAYTENNQKKEYSEKKDSALESENAAVSPRCGKISGDEGRKCYPEYDISMTRPSPNAKPLYEDMPARERYGWDRWYEHSRLRKETDGKKHVVVGFEQRRPEKAVTREPFQAEIMREKQNQYTEILIISVLIAILILLLFLFCLYFIF